MKIIKPARVYTALTAILTVLVLVGLYNWRAGNAAVQDIQSRSSDQIDFSNSVFMKDYAGRPDPFIQNDFLNKKLLQLVSSVQLAARSDVVSSKAVGNETTTNFSYLLDELMTAVKVHNFFSYTWGCKETDSLQVGETSYETKHSIVYAGIYQNEAVAVEIAKADVDVLISAKCGSSDSDHSQENLDRCFLLKNRWILEESVLLMQLTHANIAKTLGLCIRRVNPTEKHVKVSSSSGVVLMKATGDPVRLEQLKTLGWEKRLKACLDLLNLAVYFINTPLGSIRLETWNPENFIMNSKDGRMQLNNFDQPFYFTETACATPEDCFIDGMNCGVKCTEQRCEGYNAKKNLYELNHSFLSPLLRYNVPQQMSDIVLNILVRLNNLRYNSVEVVSSLKRLLPQSQPGKFPQNILSQHEMVNNNPAVVSMRRLPDGSQVDSWEQHELKVSINELNFDIVEQAQPPEPIRLNDLDSPLELQKETSEPGGFQKIENADYPGRYDYYCPQSKAEWGCVMSLHTAEDAMQKCLEDDKCKAFVTIPHLRKEGWIIAILKSDNSKPVDHTGTTVYLRNDGGAKSQPNLPLDVDFHEQQDCLKDSIIAQSKVRLSNEAGLMESCGWSGMTDNDWTALIKEGAIEDAHTFKPARGKLANGGQMGIVLNEDSKSRNAIFLAKRGPDEFDVSQLAVYQLDRMLGLYKTIPAIERLMSPSQLIDAGFPVDIGGNQFDKFRPLKQSDGSLLGVIVPQVTERVTVEHYISVPRLSGITNAVTPFNKRQWDDMEYLLLGFLAAIPIPTKGHQSVQGHLLHLKTDEAFLRNSNDYISYLYNCQFPSHVINTLRHSVLHRCELGGQIRTRLLDSSSPQIASVLKANVAQLLELVDQCITRFGKQIVFYDLPT